MAELKHVGVCTHYKPESDSKSKVEEAFFDLDLNPPDFLPYHDVLSEPTDLRECQYVFSDAESIGNVGLENNEFELEVFVSEDEGDDEGENREMYRLHFHVNFVEDNLENFKPLIKSVFESVPEVELNVLTTYFKIDTDPDEWNLSGPIPEGSEFERFYLEHNEDFHSAVGEYDKETVVSMRHADSAVFNTDNFFRELNQYIERDRDHAGEFYL